MQYVIGGEPRDLIEIKQFRANHNLPEMFSVSLFEPKDYTGLGRIDKSGAQLNSLRDAILDSIPPSLHYTRLMSFADQLTDLFRLKMEQINDSVGLADSEIDFAVSGFGDVLRTVVYALIRTHTAKAPLPPFMALYGEWFNSTIRISSTHHSYDHQGRSWTVQVLNHVYGRCGLVVDTGTQIHYIYDAIYACPAEGFMMTLLQQTTERIVKASGD